MGTDDNREIDDQLNVLFDDLFALYRIIPDRCFFSVAVTAKVISA